MVREHGPARGPAYTRAPLRSDKTMFENLQTKLNAVFDRLASRGKLTEQDVDVALREVRLALLEADVNFKVVKDLMARVRERAIGVEVMKSLTPAQQVVKIVHEELLGTLGEPARLDLSGPTPHVVMLVGLQGAGKTTTAAKLALSLRKGNRRSLLVAADTYRPAAVTQLEVLGKQFDITVHSEGTSLPPPEIVSHAMRRAREGAYDVVILDTAGRLQISDQMMQELEEIKRVAQAPGSAIGRGCDDGAGSGQRGARFPRARGCDRADPDQSGRRCARRRGHLDARSDRRPHQVSWRWARSWMRWSRSTPTGWRHASWAWAT